MELLKKFKSDEFKKIFFWWLILFLVLGLFHFKHYADSDEGMVLEGAWNLINGRALYYDFFEFITPGSFYLIYWAWLIFGTHYFIAKLIAILFVFFSAIGVFKISEEVTKSKSAYLTPLVFIISSFYWPLINHNTFFLLFTIWAIYFFIKGLKNYATYDFLLSGLLTGLAILFLQHKGIVILFALSLFLFILFIKNKQLILLKFNLYFIILSLFPLLILLLKWPTSLLYQSLVAFPLFNYTEANRMPVFLFLVFFIFFLLMIWHLKKEKSKSVWLLVFIQLLLFFSTIQRPDLPHISFILFPTICLAPLIYKNIKNTKTKIRYLNYLIIAPIFLMLFYSLVTYIICFTPFYSVNNSKTIQFVNHNCPGSYIYAGPFLPNVYFETRKLNPSPYPILITNHQTRQQFKEARQALEKHQPSCAVLNYKLVEKFNYNKNNPVDNYIMNNYKFIFGERNTLIYKKIN